ncbi:hypothetical protein KV102_01145 [Mumia sp. zg.B53]|uniref:hypothetical protein n=1 Tax=Mumia sp. zg.B53 TaxID=2855449 RepID=UPI001C6E00C0|nr:hypothetical protein [Mumia sp. zg.B53]MBW9213434.1 hypothetical protein [Mumia sp. zg.B53]
MTDDRQPPEGAEPRTDRGRRSEAQGAAADLARMGIDPRSLGLDTPQSQTPERRWTQESDHAVPPRPVDDANVVALRPEWATQARGHAQPAPPAVPPSATVPGSVEHPPTVAHEVVSRTVSPAPERVGGPSWVRAAARGIVTLDGAAAADAERALVAGVRRRQSGRRLVAFLSAQGGVGTTTVASGVGAVLAALRDDRTVLVDVQAGTPPLSTLQGVHDPHTVRRILAASDAATPPTAPGGLAVVDGPSWDQPLERGELGGLVDRLVAQHAFLLVDAGDDPTDGAYAAVARCDRAVVVTGPGEIGLRALEVALSRLDRVNPAAARSAVVVVVCREDGDPVDEARRAAAVVGAVDGQVVVLGRDDALRHGRPFRADQVNSQTRFALLQVAARLAEGR